MYIPQDNPFEEDRILIEVDGKYGYTDARGNIVIPAQYDLAYEFFEGLAAVNRGYQRREKLIFGLSSQGGDESNGEIHDSRWGFIDYSGREVIPLVYDEVVSSFENGLAQVRFRFYYGFIDRLGNEVVPVEYERIDLLGETLLIVQRNENWGLINYKGEEIIPFEYQKLNNAYNRYEEVTNKYLIAQKGGLFGIIDLAGTVLLPFRYKEIYGFSEGRAAVQSLNRKWGYIDESIQEAISCKYDYAGQFTEERAAIGRDEGYGYIDLLGQEVVPPYYDAVGRHYSDGLATVCIKDKWGAVDKNGIEVIPLRFSGLDTFQFGRFKGWLGHKTVNVDREGNII
jgi:hypothetical protein